MLNYKKYKRVPVVDYPEREWPNKEIEKAPIWCSVDLRDGNQALVEPMVVEEKIEMFNLLVKLGFKEIEIGFPAASQIEYDFLRQLVERKLIPDDVVVQVLTQCREHLIKRTFDAIQGIPKAIVHIYNSTSTLQREVVFHAEREEVKQIAIDGTRMVKKYMKDYDGKVILEYSPESFTGTELDFALDICTAVQEEWGATPDNKIIINLPATVEMTTPNVYADQIEWMNKHFKNRDSIILSIHPHNDRGTGIAATELALLAGADRVEGTLLGNGERTGNIDILNIAYNMFSQGINPELNLENVKEITEVCERCTKMAVDPRHPYAGKLVFTAFSGSHQDAISKGMAWQKEGKTGKRWDIPYLPIDPADVGREYESDVIRINSVSGKGGVAFVLKQQFGFSLPAAMKEEVGYLVKGISDRRHQELLPKEIYAIFEENYIYPRSIFNIPECHFKQENGIQAEVTIEQGGASRAITTMGNGRLDAVSNAIKTYFGITYELSVYEEHAISRGSNSKAATYVGIVHDGKFYWGVGVDEDIIKSSIAALVSAVNKLAAEQHITSGREERIVEIISFIQKNYVDVTLDMLVDTFHLSKPYLSKYIKEKAGMTFQEVVREERMKKARMLLKETNQTVETIAANVGYENVEHFNRLFKKAYDMTPVQYRKQSAE